MKKVFFTLALLVFTLASYAQVTEPSDNVISVEDFNVKVGKSVKFDVLLDNPTATNLAGWQLFINVPEGFTIGETAKDREDTDRTEGFTLSVQLTSTPNRYLVAGFSNVAITGHSGSVMKLTLYAPDDAVVGNTYDFTFDTAVAGNLDKVDQDCPDGSFTVTVVEDALDLYDDAEALPAASTESKVTIHRAFEGGKWNSFVAPFAISADQYKAAFGDDVQIAIFSDQNIDDSDNEIGIYFTTVTETDANQPVIIKPSADLTSVSFEGTIEVEADAEAAVQVGKKQGKNDYRSYMYANYLTKNIAADYDGEYTFPLYLKNDKLWYAPAEGVTIKGYRAYIVMCLNPTMYTDDVYGVKMYIDEDLTAINGVEVDRTNGKVYTVDGKYVGKDVNRMQKGVYIVNGKKVIK